MSDSEDEWPIPQLIQCKRPGTEARTIQLTESLARMQLLSLFTIPFDIRSVSYLQDFELEAPNLERFPHSVRGRPKRWTLDNVADSFQIPSVGKIVVSRKVSYASKFFTGHRNPRHGWNISQCSSPALQAVLMFLMPIFHPRKPSYAPIGLLNTVVGSWKKGIL